MWRRLAAMAFLVCALVGLPRSTAAHNVCFPADKTPFCLVHPFADYWEANGGLPVFGYPITAAGDELNRDTNVVYFTQWAERNRFERHPENAGTPYEILLGLLGKDRLAQMGRNWQAEPRESGPKAGCLWFEQTGHNVCDQATGIGFKTYWENHGLNIPGLDRYARSLQLFGLPLTEPKMETNSSGDTVLTQWFERARFEWHPNNPNEFKVLLGLLGKEVRAGQQPTPPPAPPTGKIVFSSTRTGSGDIYAMNVDGTGLTRLTTSGDFDVEPVWSPDGKKIAYTAYQNGATTIYTMNADGTGALMFTLGWSPAWSPDGTKIAFVDGPPASPQIHVINADGTGRRILTNSAFGNMDPEWSPDSKKILFASARDATPQQPGRNDLYVMNADGSGQTRLTNDRDLDMDPDWSPDGTKIVYMSFDGSGVVGGDIGSGDVYVINADGTGRTRLSTDVLGGRAPRWSPDGKHIIFTSARNDRGTMDLYVMNANGTGVNRLTAIDTIDDADPDWAR